METAAACAHAILRHTGHRDWAGFAADWAAHGDTALRGLTVSEDVRALMDADAWIVNRMSRDPLVTIARCGRCGRATFTVDMKPMACVMTVGCVGKMTAPPTAAVMETPDQGELPV